MVEVIYHTMGFRFEKGKPDFGGSFGGHLEYDVIKKRPTWNVFDFAQIMTRAIALI